MQSISKKLSLSSGTKNRRLAFCSKFIFLMCCLMVIQDYFYLKVHFVYEPKSSVNSNKEQKILTKDKMYINKNNQTGKFDMEDLPIDIDAVFLYVNGSDPVFLHELQHFQKEYSKKEMNAQRYRDVGQLKYGLRSIFKFAPWVRNIYIIVSNKETQTPCWLNTTHTRLKMVEHKAIWRYPDTVLPSFNSHAMEWSLMNIPGISRNIFYFNDDFALTNFISPLTHIWDGELGRQILYEYKEAPRVEYLRNRGNYGNSAAFARRLFDEKFGIRKKRKLGQHVPWLMNSTILNMIATDFEPFLKQMFVNGPFRTPKDLQTMFVYQQYIRESSIINEYSVAPDYRDIVHFDDITDEVEHNRNVFNKIKNDVTKLYLCLQDKMENPSKELVDEVIQFYEDYFPLKAPWEL